MERVYTAPLLDKLGVRPGMRIAILGVLHDDVAEAAAFRADLGDRTSDVTEGRPKPDTDLVFLAVDAVPDLDVLAQIRPCLRPAGGVWVVSRKGRAATIRDVEVMAAARGHELVDNKVVSFSPTRTAIRLVIPVALRPRA
jgi:hypothetical protein